MSWLRQGRNGIAVVALVALALQMLLAFGHRHAGQHHAALPLASGLSAFAAGASTDTPVLPDGGPGDDCAICASMALAQTLTTPQSPSLAPPAKVTAEVLVPATSDGRGATQRTVYRSRAPPIS